MGHHVILESTSVGLTVLDRQAPDKAWHARSLTVADILRMAVIYVDVPVDDVPLGELYDRAGCPDEATAGM